MRLPRIGLVGTAVLALALTVTGVAPANALPVAGQTTMLDPDWQNWCVDSDTDGNVYTKTCNRENLHQQWKWVAAGKAFTIRNVKTGRCLTGDGGSVVTRVCDGATNQEWFTNDDNGRTTLLNHATSYYLGYEHEADRVVAYDIDFPWKTPAIS